MRWHTRLPAKRTSPFKSAGTSVKSTTGNRISGSNAGYTMFRGSAKSTGYPRHSPVSPSLPIPCVTLYHHISTAVYPQILRACVQNFVAQFTWGLGFVRTPPSPRCRCCRYQRFRCFLSDYEEQNEK